MQADGAKNSTMCGAHVVSESILLGACLDQSQCCYKTCHHRLTDLDYGKPSQSLVIGLCSLPWAAACATSTMHCAESMYGNKVAKYNYQQYALPCYPHFDIKQLLFFKPKQLLTSRLLKRKNLACRPTF